MSAAGRRATRAPSSRQFWAGRSQHCPTPGGGRGDLVGCAKGAARAVRTRVLGVTRPVVELNTGNLQAAREGADIPFSISRAETSSALRRPLAATGDLADPTSLVVELNTRDLQATREGAGIPCPISRAETPSALRRPLTARAGGDARPHCATSSREVFAAPAGCLCSNATSLASNSPPSTKARAEVTKFITCVASPGDRMPSAQAARTVCPALTKSPALSIGGRSNTTGRSRSGGKSSPTQKRNAGPSPAKALAMSTRVSSSAAPSSMASSASVALLREPLGRPLRRTPQRSANDCSPLIGIAGIAPAAGSRSSMVVALLRSGFAHGDDSAERAPFYHLQI
jgi:hypothetical protein